MAVQLPTDPGRRGFLPVLVAGQGNHRTAGHVLTRTSPDAKHASHERAVRQTKPCHNRT